MSIDASRAEVLFDKMVNFDISSNEYDRVKDDLEKLIRGDNVFILSVIAPGGKYSEREARRLVDEIMEMYEYLASYYRADSELIAESDYSLVVEPSQVGPPDLHQEKFLRGLLYCMLRLVANSPWYDGTFGDFRIAYKQLMESFSDEPSKEDIWKFDCSTAGNRATLPKELEDNPMFKEIFPLLTGISDWPGSFLGDLNSIYEAFSGKRVVETIPVRQRERIEKELEEKRARSRRAAEGNPGDGDKEADSKLGGVIGVEAPDGEGVVKTAEEFFADMKKQREKQLTKWVRDFPKKDEWCKQYVVMRRAYFKLEGFDPLSWKQAADGKDIPDEEVEAVGRISIDVLGDAIDVVMDDRKLSHFGDSVYDAVVEGMLRTASSVLRAIDEGQ